MDFRRLKTLGVASLLLAAVLIAGCDEDTWRSKVRLVSAKTAIAPKVDGIVDVGIWDEAQDATATLAFFMGPDQARVSMPDMEVYLRAVHTDTHVYILAQWHTSGKADMYSPFVWNGEYYELEPQADDAIKLMFKTEGSYKRLLDSGSEFRADLWHWGAGCTNPSKYARDAQLILNGSQTNAKAEQYTDSVTGRRLWWWDLDDAGTPAMKVQSPGGRNQGEVLPSYVPQEPSGSAADVQAVGLYDEEQGMWTVEFSRKLTTGQADDVQFDLTKTCTMALSITLGDREQSQAVEYLSPLMQIAFQGESANWAFDQYQPGEHVMGMEMAASNWIAKEDPTAPSKPMVYGQVAHQQRSDVMPAALYAGGIYADFSVAASIRLLPGSTERAGGLIFRQYDLENYYLMEVSASTGKVAIHKVVDGVSQPLVNKTEPGLEGQTPAPEDEAGLKPVAVFDVRRGDWYRIKVECKGSKITGYLNGEAVVALEDSATMNGRIGLWTRGDTIAHFDDLSVKVQPIAAASQPEGPATK